MKFVIALLMVSLFLSPSVAAGHMPMADSMSQPMSEQMSEMTEHTADDEHACCDETDMMHTSVTTTAMDCDDDCGDCQSHCSTTASALMPSLIATGPQNHGERLSGYQRPFQIETKRQLRPPMPV